jgi:uncharacterized membrane protein YdjX (TVP38/TMEM64 family)
MILGGAVGASVGSVLAYFLARWASGRWFE